MPCDRCGKKMLGELGTVRCAVCRQKMMARAAEQRCRKKKKITNLGFHSIEGMQRQVLAKAKGLDPALVPLCECCRHKPLPDLS